MGPAAADAPAAGQESEEQQDRSEHKVGISRATGGGRTGCLGINCLIGIVTRLKLASCGRAVFPPGVMENYEWEK